MNIDTSILISATSAVGTVAGMAALIAPRLRRLNYIFDDWNGEAARPGVPRRPGVMERLEQIEEKLNTMPNNDGVRKLDVLITELLEEMRKENEKAQH